MVDDPYSILGVSRTADKETIKKAYRQTAKKYHPDLNQHNAAECEEKMKELNEAYDILMNPGKYTSKNARQNTYRQNSTNSGYRQTNQQSYGNNNYAEYNQTGGFGAFDFEDLFGFTSNENRQYNTRPQHETNDSPMFQQAVDAINRGQYQNALNILIYVKSNERNARWYYLCSYANYGLNNTVQAIDQIQRACSLEPDNQVYQQLLRQYHHTERTYDQNASGFDMHAVNIDKICIGLCLGRIFCGPFCRCI